MHRARRRSTGRLQDEFALERPRPQVQRSHSDTAWRNRATRSRGQKRTVSRSAEDPLRVGPVGGGPVEPGEDSGERTWIMLYPIGDDGQAKRRKTQGVAIGAESKAFALRREPRDDAGQNRVAANFAQRLVAAAHSPRQTAREDHPRHAGSFSHRSRRFGVPQASTFNMSLFSKPVNVGSRDRTTAPPGSSSGANKKLPRRG